MSLSVFVAEDEPLARRRLNALIAEVPWASQVGEAADGLRALEEIERLAPDIVVLDIHMPGLSGIQIVERLRGFGKVPAVVFATAFDEHAVAAFELEAVDYLLKPFGQERFRVAIERVRTTLESRAAVAAMDRARGVLTRPRLDGPLERIMVRQGPMVIPLALSDIARIEAQDDYAMVHAHGREYLIGMRIRDLEMRLPCPPFLRVHRSHVVNLDHVERMIATGDSRYHIHMEDGDTIKASRARSREIRKHAK